MGLGGDYKYERFHQIKFDQIYLALSFLKEEFTSKVLITVFYAFLFQHVLLNAIISLQQRFFYCDDYQLIVFLFLYHS